MFTKYISVFFHCVRLTSKFLSECIM